MDDFFNQMGSVGTLSELEPAAANEYRQRLSHACGAANGLYASGLAIAWPSEELSLQPEVLASHFGGGVVAPAAGAAHPTAKRTGARTKRPSAAALARAAAGEGGAMQPAAEASAQPEAQMPPPQDAPAPPRRRSGAKRRSGAPLALSAAFFSRADAPMSHTLDGSAPKRRRARKNNDDDDDDYGSPVPGTPAPPGSGAAAASARAREAATARETALAIKAAHDELRSMPLGSVRLVLTVMNKRTPAAAAAPVPRGKQPRDRSNERSFIEREKMRLEKVAQKRAADEAAAAEQAQAQVQGPQQLAMALHDASGLPLASFAPPAAAAADVAMLQADAQVALATPPAPAAPEGRLLPIFENLPPLPPPPPLLPENPQLALLTFAQHLREGTAMAMPPMSAEQLRALHQGVMDKGTAEALYSNPDLDAVPPFRLASDGIERMASWAAATCGMQLALPQQPVVVEQLALEQAFVLPPPQQPAPSFAMPMMPMDQTELARRWLGLFSVPQPSPQLLRGLVAGAQQQQQQPQQQQSAVLALPEVLPSPAQPQSPPVAQEAQPKPESAAATPASPAKRRLRPPAAVAEEYVRVQLIITEAGRVSFDGSGSAAPRPAAAAPAAAAGVKRPRPRRSEPGAATAIAPPLLLEIAARRAAATSADEEPSSAVVLYATESRHACTDPQCHTQPTLWADVGSNPPSALLRGSDPAFWGALRGQGALMLRAGGVWDPATKRSTLMDVSWLTGGNTKLRTMGSEYQYIRQTLPASNGFVEVYEDYLPPDAINADYPFGALVEDIQESFRFAAESFRLLGVPDRERYFLAQMRAGLRLQFPYLQGVALNALNGRAVQGCLRATPPGGAHAWDPSGLPVCEGSILPGLLRQCEACCNPLLNAPPPAPEAGAAAAVPMETRPASPPRPARDLDADRAAEVAATGAAAPARDGAAFAHQVQRRQAGQHALRAASSRRSRSGTQVKKPRRDREPPPPAAEEPAVAAADADAEAGAAPAADPGTAGAAPGGVPPAVPTGASAAEAAAQASMSKLWGAGIVTPWLYYMGVCSTFAAHFEDYAFGSANVIVAPPDTQAWVIWYSVPRESLAAFHAFLRDLLGKEYTLDCLEGRRLWIDPRLVAEWNARQPAGSPTCPVYRHVQGPGDYVVTDYGSVHWGVNLGVGWKAAVNFAFEDWRPAAEQVDAVYAQLERETGQKRHYRCAPEFGGERCRGAFDDVTLAAFALRREAAAGDAPPLPPLAPLAEREAAAAAAFAKAVAEAKEGKLDAPAPMPQERPAKAPRLAAQPPRAQQPRAPPPQQQQQPEPRGDEPMAEAPPPMMRQRSPSPAPRAASPSPPPAVARLLTPDLPQLPEDALAAAALLSAPLERFQSYAPAQAHPARAVTPDVHSPDTLGRAPRDSES